MKTALITGASSGIGAEAARCLAAQGWRVVLVARRSAALDAVAADIGARAIVEACDAASGPAVTALAHRVRDRCGLPDAIVHCAGAGRWKRVEETTPDEALEMLRAPYLAAFNVTQAFLGDMIQRRSGVLIHVNSPAAFFPWPGCAGYAAARWALRGLHESLRQELAGTGVQSCHLVLGRVDSPYFEHNPGVAEAVPRIAALVPTLTVQACGRVIARLASHPRTEVLHPFMLRLFGWSHRIAPGLVRWGLRITGARRRAPVQGPALD